MRTVPRAGVRVGTVPRAGASTKAIPAARARPYAIGVAVLLLLAAAPFGLSTFALATLTLGLCNGLFAYGLDLAWGRAGLLSVGHAAFFGLGAYAVAIAQEHARPAWPAAVAATAVAVLVAVPVVRIGLGSKIPDAPLILLTIGVSLLFQRLATSSTDLTGGTNGLSVHTSSVVSGFYLTLAVVAVTVLVTTLTVVRSRFGARLTAAHRNPERAAQTGIDPVRARTIAFAASAAVSAVAGALYAPAAGLVSPQIFGLGLSTSVLVWLALGGRGTTVGPFAGAVVVTFGDQMLGSSWQGWYVFALAAVFVLVVQFAPAGLAGLPGLIRKGPALRLPPAAHQPAAARPQPAKGQPAGTTAPPAGAEAALELNGVKVAFGPVEVVRGVNLTVPAGRCVCLIGPNGAGKSTLLAAVAGQLGAAAGNVAIFGSDATRTAVHERARLGLGRMFQIPAVITELSPADNLRLARLDAPDQVELPGEYDDLTADDACVAGELPLADRRRLELAMVLAGAPRLMLLDEPAAGLGPDDARALIRELKEAARRSGCAMVVVEHDMDIVRELADDVVVLHDGKVIAHGALAEITADPVVREAYLGVH
ncbi:ATP-binding cassette domain-containing protein [Streptomyces sp. NPDC050145]|uniref:branched-chain amino acid ABC transporter ATP-binding protein/permease n=1 Tax=Streptomyces sp. NPDC050145 TaxID=3365602 RepID=UPI0037B1FE30